MLSLHFSFGFAPHIEHRTDNVCRNVGFSGFTSILFNIAESPILEMVNFASFGHVYAKTGI